MDELDLKILNILHKDSRISITDISKLVNLSRPSVSERIEKMIDSGIIESFTLTVNLEKTRMNILCFLELSDLKITYEKVEDLLLKMDNVIDIYRVTGKSNYLVKAAFSSITDMNKTLEELMKYSRVDTKVVLDSKASDRLVL